MSVTGASGDLAFQGGGMVETTVLLPVPFLRVQSCFLLSLCFRGVEEVWALHWGKSASSTSGGAGFMWDAWIQAAIPSTFTAVGVVALSSEVQGSAHDASGYRLYLQLQMDEMLLRCRARRWPPAGSILLSVPTQVPLAFRRIEIPIWSGEGKAGFNICRQQ